MASPTFKIAVNCDVAARYSLALSTGMGGSYLARRMRSGADALDYQLYRDNIPHGGVG